MYKGMHRYSAPVLDVTASVGSANTFLAMFMVGVMLDVHIDAEDLGPHAPHRLRCGAWSLRELGCVGFSGGGMQTLYLAAPDERVRWALISGYLYGVRDALLTLNNNCSCNYQHSPRGYFL